MSKGRMKWVPSIVIEEIDNIKREDGIPTDSDAMKKLVDNSRKGKLLNWEIKEINKKLPEVFRIGKKKRGLFE